MKNIGIGTALALVIASGCGMMDGSFSTPRCEGEECYRTCDEQTECGPLQLCVRFPDYDELTICVSECASNVPCLPWEVCRPLSLTRQICVPNFLYEEPE